MKKKTALHLIFVTHNIAVKLFSSRNIGTSRNYTCYNVYCVTETA